MKNLYFGQRARWRARRREHIRRVAIAWGVVSMAAGALGFTTPGGIGSELTEKLISDRKAVRVASTGFESSEIAESAMRFRRKAFENRPTPTPSPTQTPAAEAAPVATGSYSGSVVDIIYAAAAEFGVSGDWMVAIAECESTLNPNAHNPAGYYGLFQYDQTTWAEFGYGSIYDPVAQARTTAELLAAGQSSRWPSCA